MPLGFGQLPTPWRPINDNPHAATAEPFEQAWYDRLASAWSREFRERGDGDRHNGRAIAPLGLTLSYLLRY